MNAIFGNTMHLTERSLDYLWQKQEVTLNNLANNDTPGFKAQFVSFEDHLKQRLQRSSSHQSRGDWSQEISAAKIRLRDTGDESARLDGNNVQVDVESVELARAQIQYQAQVQSINSDIGRLRAVIKGQ